MDKVTLKENLLKLDQKGLKLFYCILVHYWVKKKYFINDQNFLDLWCELNKLCSEVDEGFPDPYDDYELLKSFCQANPFYFIDRLDSKLIINLFCHYLNDQIDILSNIASKLNTEDITAIYTYSNKALNLNEDVDELASQTELVLNNSD